MKIGLRWCFGQYGLPGIVVTDCPCRQRQEKRVFLEAEALRSVDLADGAAQAKIHVQNSTDTNDPPEHSFGVFTSYSWMQRT